MTPNNKQATFKKQTPDNIEKYLNDVIVHDFLNKMYKLQKLYIWHMTPSLDMYVHISGLIGLSN
eukprot:12652917-Ditylum_brightwellii.AAC.2